MKKTAKNAAATKIVNVPMVIESQNQQYGFWGTTKLNPRVKVAEEWTGGFRLGCPSNAGLEFRAHP